MRFIPLIIQYHQLCVAVVTVGFSEQPLPICFDYAIRLEGSCVIAVWAMLVCSTMLKFRVLNCVMPKFTIFYPVHTIHLRYLSVRSNSEILSTMRIFLLRNS